MPQYFTRQVALLRRKDTKKYFVSFVNRLTTKQKASTLLRMSIKVKLIYIFLSFILSIPNIYPQTTMEGLVCDYSNDSALVGCKVTFFKNNKVGYTDSLGRFSCSLKCDCIDSILIEKDGYCSLIVENVDPGIVNSTNELIFYLNKEKKSLSTFNDLLKKKFFGITYKRIYLAEFYELSSCCSLKDTSYYKGFLNHSTVDSLNYRKSECKYISTLSEISKKVQGYYNKHPDSIYFSEYDKYAYLTNIYDTIGTSPCYVFNDQGSPKDTRFPGGDKELSFYIKKEIKKLNIKHEEKIIIQFIVERGIGNFSNFKIAGVSQEDTDKLIEIIKQGPKWIPSGSGQPQRRIKKEIVIDMIEYNE